MNIQEAIEQYVKEMRQEFAEFGVEDDQEIYNALLEDLTNKLELALENE